MASQYNELDQVDDVELDKFPGESGRLQSVKILLSRPACKLIIVSVILILLFLCTVGASIGIGYSIGKAVNSETDTCNCPSSDKCPLYSIEDFDSEPIPSLPNVFDPLTLKPLNITTEWPEGIYHPLLKPNKSPDYVQRFSTDYEINRNDISQRAIVETNEYQLRLEPERFINRTIGAEQFNLIAGQYLGQFISQLDEPEEQMYYELQYEKHGCGADYSELRIRNFISGKHAGKATSSVNRDCHNKIDMVETLMFPPADFVDNFEMKMEQDVHVCGSKFNRKVKLKHFPYGETFSCENLNRYYPSVFYDKSLFEDSPLELHSNKTWWNLSQTGYLFGNTTKFKTSFNIGYEPGEEAFIEGSIPNHSSEWSIRIYSFNDGYGVWDEYVLATMGDFYKFLLEQYGSWHEDPETC